VATIYAEDWSGGNSTFTSVDVYERAVQGVDPLYPYIKVAESVTVIGGKVDWNGTYGNYGSSGLVFDGFPSFGQQGSISVKYTPNATVIGSGSGGLYFVPLIEVFNAINQKMFYMGMVGDGSPGAPFILDFSARVWPFPTWNDLYDQQPAPTFVAGQEYTFKICWKCGTPTGAPITSVASDGYVKYYIDGVSVGEMLNIPFFIDANNANDITTISLASDVVHSGSGLFGAMGDVLFADSECTSTVTGSAAFGVDGTVTATRAVLFSLDGETNTHSDAGVLKICGDLVVTGDVTFTGDVTVSEPSSLMDSIVTTGSEIVYDSSGNVVVVES
jgi:hypothetical protein